LKKRLFCSAGQSLVEFALVLPLVLVLSLGVVEVAYALLDQQVVTKLTREGSNLISRDTGLQVAAQAMTSMSTRPVDFNTSSRLIFSVIKRGATVGSTNYNKDILYQRYEFGALSAQSALTTSGSIGSFPAPDYQAPNSDNNGSLQVTNLPANLLAPGGLLYVTEIFTTHTLITPFNRLGITVPNRLYSIAYF
jgi:hypothetical protein